MIPVAAEITAFTALFTLGGAALIDAVRFEIPNRTSLGILALALVFGALDPHFDWWSHLAALLAMFSFGLLAFSRNWLGGGDVKLMTAIAAWTGLPGLPMMFIATSIAGGVLALAMLVVRRSNMFGGCLGVVAARPAAPVPYAIAIASGTLWWLWASNGGPLAVR